MKETPTHGGKRKGSGKPKIVGGKPYTYILIQKDIEAIKGPKAAFVREAIRLHLDRVENGNHLPL